MADRPHQVQNAPTCALLQVETTLDAGTTTLEVGDNETIQMSDCIIFTSPLLSSQVEIAHDAGTTTLEVGDDETILEAALASGLELSHDCKMGVCMTCPAKLVRRLRHQHCPKSWIS